MIKKWSQFNESKAEKPGESIPGSAKINLSDEDVNSFTDNQSLQKLISDDKVALLGNEAWYWEDDMETKGILDQYLEIPGTVEEEPISEYFGKYTPFNPEQDTTLHIVKLKIEEALNKSSKAKGIESDTFYKHFSGKEEAYRDVLDMISKFEK